jgi:hypothetical protein
VVYLERKLFNHALYTILMWCSLIQRLGKCVMTVWLAKIYVCCCCLFWLCLNDLHVFWVLKIVVWYIDDDKNRAWLYCILELSSISYIYESYCIVLYREPTKVARRFLEDGTKVRVSKKTGHIIPKPDPLADRMPRSSGIYNVMWSNGYLVINEVMSCMLWCEVQMMSCDMISCDVLLINQSINQSVALTLLPLYSSCRRKRYVTRRSVQSVFQGLFKISSLHICIWE